MAVAPLPGVTSDSAAPIAVTPIAVALVTGFLGAGKTTLVNAILRDPRYADTAVIVNEFGTVGLDALLIERATDNVLLLDSGCLCCAMRDGLRETLADLFVRRVKGDVPAFTRVIVETSGLADPGPIAAELVSDALVRTEFRLAGIVTVVDAVNAPGLLDPAAPSWEATRQVALADTLVLAKGDLVAPAALAALEASLAAINPSASRVQAVRGALAPDTLFQGQGARLAQTPPGLLTRGRIGPRDAHLRGVASTAFTTDAPLDWPALAAWMREVADRFGKRLLRAKALVALVDGGTVVLHAIAGVFHPPERLAAWPEPLAADAARHSRFVLIGRDVEAAALHASFAALGAAEVAP